MDTKVKFPGKVFGVTDSAIKILNVGVELIGEVLEQEDNRAQVVNGSEHLDSSS